MIPTFTLGDLIPHEPTELFLTSFSVDEEELFTLSFHLNLSRSKVRVHYEAGLFRSFGPSLVPRQWLKPVQFANSQTDWGNGRIPPCHHGKIALAQKGGAYFLAISTGNLSRSDQRSSQNLVCAIDLSANGHAHMLSSARQVKGWLNNPGRGRTLVAIQPLGKYPTIHVTNDSSWAEFTRAIIATGANIEHGEWLLCSPFWSGRSLKRIASKRPASVTCYFASDYQAQEVAASAVEALGRLQAFAPRKGAFHHKLIAWRGKVRGQFRVILYVGSANMTSAGFFGAGAKARNIEAGTIVEGDNELWSKARALAKGTPIWKMLHIKSRVKDQDLDKDIGATSDADTQDFLSAHLRSTIVVNSVALRARRRRLADPLNYRLKSVELSQDDQIRAFPINTVRKVSSTASNVSVIGTYQAAGSTIIIHVSLPELAVEPREENRGPSLSALRRLLLADTEPDKKKKRKNERVSDATSRIDTDVRFPFSDLFEKRALYPQEAEHWLRYIQAASQSPAFWQQLAKRIT